MPNYVVKAVEAVVGGLNNFLGRVLPKKKAFELDLSHIIASRPTSFVDLIKQNPDPVELIGLDQKKGTAIDITTFENTIENASDLVYLRPSNPARQDWEQLVYWVASGHLNHNNLEKAVHFYQKIRPDSSFATKAYFELGNIYFNLDGNPQEAKHYFNLAAQKGDLDAAVMSQVCTQLIQQATPKESPDENSCNSLFPNSSGGVTVNNIRAIREQLNGVKIMQNPTETTINQASGEGNRNNNNNNNQTTAPAAAQETPPAVKAETILIPIPSSMVTPKDRPKHLADFYTECDPSKQAMEVSSFYQAVKKLVADYKRDEMEKEPFFFKEIWQLRKQDVDVLDNELTSGVAFTHFNDTRLYILCQKIAAQSRRAFFGRSELPLKLKDILIDAAIGKLHVNLPFSSDYENLQENIVVIRDQLSRTEQTVERLSTNKHKMKLSFKERLEAKDRQWNEQWAQREQAWAKEKQEAEAKAAKEKQETEAKAAKEKQEAEAKAAKEKQEAEAKAAKEKQEAEAKWAKEKEEWAKEREALKKEIQELKDAIKELRASNIKNGKLAVANEEKARLYDKYVATKNYKPTFFAASPSKRIDKIPDFLICPITQDLMTDPVIANDGYTYERSAILKWFQTNQTSPMSGKKIHTEIMSNLSIREQISDWLQFVSTEQNSAQPQSEHTKEQASDNNSNNIENISNFQA